MVDLHNADEHLPPGMDTRPEAIREGTSPSPIHGLLYSLLGKFLETPLKIKLVILQRVFMPHRISVAAQGRVRERVLESKFCT